MSEWRTRAACLGTDTNIFFPIDSGRPAWEQAKQICNRCPVQTQCAETGRHEQFGMWGGTTPVERHGKKKCRAGHTLAKWGFQQTAGHIECRACIRTRRTA